MNQRGLLWLGDDPCHHRTTFQPTEGTPSLSILSPDCQQLVLHIDDERTAQNLWAALRLTFPTLALPIDTNAITDG